MLYRRPTQLAVQASLLLALEPEGSLYRVGDLADTLGVGAPYLAKVLQSLTRAGVLRAVRGPGGGVRFARSPREIHLWDILSAVEPANEFERCFLGLKPCSDLNSCPLHEDWAPSAPRFAVCCRQRTCGNSPPRPELGGCCAGNRRTATRTGSGVPALKANHEA